MRPHEKSSRLKNLGGKKGEGDKGDAPSPVQGSDQNPDVMESVSGVTRARDFQAGISFKSGDDNDPSGTSRPLPRGLCDNYFAANDDV